MYPLYPMYPDLASYMRARVHAHVCAGAHA